MDVQRLKGSLIGHITKPQLLDTITNRDLVLSNQYDDNDILTVVGKCTVVYRQPIDEIPPPDLLPPGVFVSRYSISFGDTPGTSILTAFDGESQPWPDDMIEAPHSANLDDDEKKLPNDAKGKANYQGTSLGGCRSAFHDADFSEADIDGSCEAIDSKTRMLPIRDIQTECNHPFGWTQKLWLLCCLRR
jgi:hypothetical protein